MSKIKLIDNFINKVKELYSPDVGDFKRKIILYIKRLQEDLNDPFFDPIFEKIKLQVICNNNLVETEELRHQIIDSMVSLKSSFKENKTL